MARAGRKKKWPPKKKAEAAQRRKPIQATSEWNDKFRALVGRSRRNNMDDALASPLTLLKEWGHVTEHHVTAGHSYGYLYWHRFGDQTPGVPFYGDMVGNGSIGLPRAIADAASDDKELMFKEWDERLALSGGREQVRWVTLDTMIDPDDLKRNLPHWFLRYLRSKKAGKSHVFNFTDALDKKRLINGLESLI